MIEDLFDKRFGYESIDLYLNDKIVVHSAFHLENRDGQQSYGLRYQMYNDCRRWTV